MVRLLAGNIVTTAYNLALVLVGGSDSAESIVTTAIEAIPANDLSEATLLTEVASTAWSATQSAFSVFDATDETDSATLPCDLQDLCNLPRALRYCFSLRFLVGMTSYACGKIIGLRSDQVDYLIMRSMIMLAKAAERRDQPMLAAAL